MNFEKPSVVLCEDDKSALDLYNIFISVYPQDDICYFPAHDSLPFSDEKSSKEILLERSFQLIKLQKQKIIIISCNNLLKKFFIQHDNKHYFKLDINQEISLSEILETLVNFEHVNNANVYNRCEFSHRGDILDIYNYHPNPYRISFFDNTIESIREFSPQTQLTNKKSLDSITIVNPNYENKIDSSEGISLLSYLENRNIYSFNRSDIVLFDRINFFKSIYEKTELTNPYSSYYLDNDDIKDINFTNIQSSTPIFSLKNNNVTLEQLKNEKKKIFIYQGNILSNLQKEYDEKIKVVPSLIDNLTFQNTTISKNYELDHSIHLNLYSKKINTEKTNHVVNFNDLNLGDAVVHHKHGIGRFISIDRIDIDKRTREFIRLIYRNNDKLLLPIENLNLISRYGFDDNNLILDKLGSSDWLLRKSSVKKRIKFLANKLIKNAAKRNSISINPLNYSQLELDKFNEKFEFIETEDQLTAIENSLHDLIQEKPANRLICGDVGFGKTEVALRIACATYLSGYQFVIVVPTTLLAIQHSRTFTSRFSIFNTTVATLSRFTSLKEKKQILERLKNGDIQILIATHSLFKKDIEFNNLGTLVIDEEQKFGVDQKEFMINKYPHIHLFSLSATPIPRTLQMSLLGLKDLSVIGTPPSNRISIRTYVQKYEQVSFLTAITNEISRGGQVFIVVPRISNIPFVENELKKLQLDVSYGVGHSKMKEKEIEDVFLSFTNGDIQCLISTNIIESGIDIKNANTLIIFNSNLFGLSQLYQLRGRVGRSNRRAYAYLFHDNEKLINKTALKKLQVLANYENLGSNFQLANEDLEIRGAGNLLGDEQSGHVKEIGIELYQSMLKEEVERLKSNGTEEEEIFEEFEFNAFFEYYIPKDYISDDISRLIMYRKLTNAISYKELKDVLYEMEDRYGSYPLEVKNLINLLTIKIQSISLGIIKINLQKKYIDLVFHKVNQNISAVLLDMVQQNFIKMKSSKAIQINNVEKEDLFYSIKLFYKKLFY